MTDLTEQWKKGKLPDGWYYTKLWKGCNVIDKFIGNQFLRYDDSDIVEVFAPVPSYEEWQKLLSDQLALKSYESPEIQKILIDWRTGELDRKFNKLEAENTKLKELLEIAVKRIEFLKKKTGAPYYGNNNYLKTIYQMCDKTLRQIQELKNE